MRSAIRVLRVVLVGVVCACGAAEASAPAVVTIEAAQESVDRTVTAVNWEVRDVWKGGGRDVVVWVRISNEAAPRFYLVAHDAGPLTPAALRHRAEAIKLLARLDVEMERLWALGGRDVIVSVQLEPTIAPHYFRLSQPVVAS